MSGACCRKCALEATRCAGTGGPCATAHLSGQSGDDAFSQMSAELDPGDAAKMQAYAADASKISSAASPVVRALASGQAPDPQAMVATVATAASLIAGPEAGAAIMMTFYLGETVADLMKAVLKPLGLLASGTVINDRYCGWIDLTTGETPPNAAAYGDPTQGWQSLPLPNCQGFPNADPQSVCDFSSSGDSTDGLPFLGVGPALYALRYAPQGSFPEFFAHAVLANAELAWNCQPSHVPVTALLQACLQIWNATHDGSRALTVTPIDGAKSYAWGAAPLDWTDPMTFVGLAADAWYEPQGTLVSRLAVTTINDGALLPPPPLNLHGAVELHPAPSPWQGASLFKRPVLEVPAQSFSSSLALARQSARAAADATSRTDAAAWVQANVLCASLGDPTCQARVNSLRNEEASLKRSAAFWVSYYNSPRTERAVLLDSLAVRTITAGQVERARALLGR